MMKSIIIILALAVTGCASVKIDIVTSDYIPESRYCYEGLSGEIDQFKSNANMTALETDSGMIIFAPNDDVVLCDE